jgi:hypothetical protein
VQILALAKGGARQGGPVSAVEFFEGKAEQGDSFLGSQAGGAKSIVVALEEDSGRAAGLSGIKICDDEEVSSAHDLLVFPRIGEGK